LNTVSLEKSGRREFKVKEAPGNVGPGRV